MKKIVLLFTILSFSLSFGQSDCTSAISVCGDSGLSYTPVDDGNVEEDLGGCLLSDENFSVWYTFTVAESGTLSFVITPNNGTDDYDWGVYGPNVTCATLGAPIRCSYASGGASGPQATTGLNDTATDATDGTGGPLDGFSSQLNVVAGETYYLIVDNWASTANGFSLTWGGTATLVSAFDNPAIQPNPFIAPGDNQDGEITICSSPELFDFSALSEGIINGNPNFSVGYYLNANDAITGDNPITSPINVTTGVTYYYTISYTDPDDPNNAINDCRQNGEITFVQGNITTNDTTLTACHNNNSGVATFNLDNAVVYGGTASNTRKYYPTLEDLNNNTNEIQNPQVYQSAEGSVFVLVTTESGCFNHAEITLQFLPEVVVEDKELTTCFIPSEPTTGLFNLSNVTVTQVTGVNLEYYLSEQDAVDGNNAIADPNTFVSLSTDVFVKVINQSGCYNIAKVKLTVVPPTYSEMLKDKIICVEDVTRLSAGPDFDQYLWSTGDTTYYIDNVTVGTYWVNLTKNGCVTKQEVKVIASPVPIIKDVKVKNNTMTLDVQGGTKPYKYSLNGVDWQDSNTFENLPRGQNFVYVKDAYNCEAVELEVTVPNLVNVITPNGDGLNDYIDYSALAYKKDLVFSVYDRYENKVFENSKNNMYTWDGRVNKGKKLPTGTYWYVISWKNPTTGTPFVYKGWIMIKNR